MSYYNLANSTQRNFIKIIDNDNNITSVNEGVMMTKKLKLTFDNANDFH